MRVVVCGGPARRGMPDGKSFEQLEKEKKEAAEAKAKAEAEKKADPLVLEEDDEFEEFEQEGACAGDSTDTPCPLTPFALRFRRLDSSGGGCRGHQAVAGRLGR